MSANTRVKLRQQAFFNQQSRCYYCQQPIWEDDREGFAKLHSLTQAQAQRLQCTAEHLIARQDGGKDKQDNIVAACLHCNKWRHLSRPHNAPDPQTYKARILMLMKRGGWHSFRVGGALA